MRGARLRRRLDRVGATVVPAIDPGHLEATARWAGVSPVELLAEARRIEALCRAEGAWNTAARLAVVAADDGVPADVLRAGLADLKRFRLGTAA